MHLNFFKSFNINSFFRTSSVDAPYSELWILRAIVDIFISVVFCSLDLFSQSTFSFVFVLKVSVLINKDEIIHSLTFS